LPLSRGIPEGGISPATEEIDQASAKIDARNMKGASPKHVHESIVSINADSSCDQTASKWQCRILGKG